MSFGRQNISFFCVCKSQNQYGKLLQKSLNTIHADIAMLFIAHHKNTRTGIVNMNSERMCVYHTYVYETMNICVRKYRWEMMINRR